MSWTRRDALILDSDVPRHDSANNQEQYSKKLDEDDQHQLDGEDSGDWVDCRRAVEGVNDAVDGSDGNEGQSQHGKVEETDRIAVFKGTREALEAAIGVVCIDDEKYRAEEEHE
jgi:hypothetical protein